MKKFTIFVIAMLAYVWGFFAFIKLFGLSFLDGSWYDFPLLITFLTGLTLIGVAAILKFTEPHKLRSKTDYE